MHRAVYSLARIPTMRILVSLELKQIGRILLLMNGRWFSLAVALVAICSVASGNAGELKIASPSFRNGDNIPARFGRLGGNSNPALKIEGAPANAKSLVLIVDDPDAPGGLFTHWLIWNLDSKTTSIAERSTPQGAVEGKNDFGKIGYGGPQPPSGTHRYYFKIFALDKQLDLAAGARRRRTRQSDERARHRAGTIDGALFCKIIEQDPVGPLRGSTSSFE